MADTTVYPPPKEEFDFSNLSGFGMFTKDTKMVVATCEAGGEWSKPRAEPYGPLSLEPATTALNYGQSIFEGVKAYRTEKGRIVIFRPQKNAQRMAEGGGRMLMCPIPAEFFMECLDLAVRENAHWVPPAGLGALYIRPLFFGSGADLYIKQSSSYTMVVYVQAVGKYYAGAARMRLWSESQRAAPLGVGHIKAAGNYASCFTAQRDAKAAGFSDVLYLDNDGECIEEAASSNFFCVDSDNVVHTPKLGTILAGVTRDSVIQLVKELEKTTELRIQEGKVTKEMVFNAKEAWLTGTGAGITPVEHVASDKAAVDFPAPGPVTSMLSKMLGDLHSERTEDTAGWLHDPFSKSHLN